MTDNKMIDNQDIKEAAKVEKTQVEKTQVEKTQVEKNNGASASSKTSSDKPVVRSGSVKISRERNTNDKNTGDKKPYKKPDFKKSDNNRSYDAKTAGSKNEFRKDAKYAPVKEKVESISKVYTRPVDALGRGYGTGRGKGHSVARVWVKYNNAGENKICINKVDAIEYFKRASLVDEVQKAIKVAFTDSEVVNVDVNIDTYGGGLSGQARACKLGLARALVVLNKTLQSTLRAGGCLTRDSRVPERQKPGQPGARKQYPYNRR